MTKRKKHDKQQTFVTNRKSQCSFRQKIRNTRRHAKNPEINQARNSDFLDSGDDVNDVIKSIIKEFAVIRKADGLITGTNEVLRLLEKEKLIAILMFKNMASFSIKNCILKLCKEAGVCLIWLEDKDKHVLGPEFPKSITYGIKNESLATLENLRKLLLKLSTKRKLKDNKKDPVSFIDTSCYEVKLPCTEVTNQEVLDASTFYHSHKNLVKKSNRKETGFLSLNKFSSDEKEKDFLNYDSVARSGILSIK